MTGRYDYSGASILSLLLVTFALIFLIAERWFRRQSRFFQTTGKFRPPTPINSGFAQSFLMTGYLVVVFGLAFALPIYWLIQWTSTAWANNEVGTEFLGYIWNSLVLSGGAATLALLLGTPLAYLASRRPSRLNIICLQGAYTGYVLPGPVAALALLMVFSGIPFLYGTAFVLIVAYLIHFLPAGLQSMESAMQQVTPNLEEAARSLGARSFPGFSSSDIAIGSWRLSCGLDYHVPSMYERASCNIVASSGRIRYVGGANLARSQRRTLPIGCPTRFAHCTHDHPSGLAAFKEKLAGRVANG